MGRTAVSKLTHNARRRNALRMIEYETNDATRQVRQLGHSQTLNGRSVQERSNGEVQRRHRSIHHARTSSPSNGVLDVPCANHVIRQYVNVRITGNCITDRRVIF